MMTLLAHLLPSSPIGCLGGVMITRRDLVKPVKSEVLIGSGLTIEVSDLLIELYGARTDFHQEPTAIQQPSPSPPLQPPPVPSQKLPPQPSAQREPQISPQKPSPEEGYVDFRDLKESLGFSPALLSRRIAYLCRHKWAEAQRTGSNPSKGIHGNCQKVRITALGIRKIEPVWDNYQRLARHLLSGMPAEDLAAHFRVNKLISDKLHAPRKFVAGNIAKISSSKPDLSPRKMDLPILSKTDPSKPTPIHSPDRDTGSTPLNPREQAQR